MKGCILLVDDDEKLLRVLTLRLETEGFEVLAASNGEMALRQLEGQRPQLVLADLRMPGMDGIELLERIQLLQPGLPVVILTAHGAIPDAVEATRKGAVEFLTKPMDGDALIALLHRHLGDRPGVASDWASGIVTRSPQMLSLLADAERVARTDFSVLISGPSGSGKELLARAIHRASRRAKAPFVAINCGAVPSELLESELFGHKKGAFTGAQSDHPGLFRAAEGGTVFLDEIGDMPSDLQVKLLRVLQEREIRPVGEVRTIKVDVRVMSATHRDLKERVGEGSFREDLFYRLNVVGLKLPPLSDRREDIPLLVNSYLKTLHGNGAPRRVYAPEAMELLVAADWPGNVRQLFNVVEQNVALCPSSVIGASFLQKSLGLAPSQRSVRSFDEARAEFSRNYLRELLEITQGNVTQAARLADRNRTDFYKLLNRHEVNPALFKDDKGG